MNNTLYFSYGSNMSVRRLQSRISTFHIVGCAKLEEHTLKFHKKSRDGSGKCDAAYMGCRTDIVFGVVFEITISQLHLLNKIEGLGNGYEQKKVPVITEDGDVLDALTYYATDIDSSLKPYEWYKKHVLFGANEHGLPANYIATVEEFDAISDFNKKRQEEELGIYY